MDFPITLPGGRIRKVQEHLVDLMDLKDERVYF